MIVFKVEKNQNNFNIKYRIIKSVFVITLLCCNILCFSQGQVTRHGKGKISRTSSPKLTLEQIHEKGINARTDPEAIKWFTKAAEQGYAPSMERLAFYYDHGYGVPEDKEKAFFWFYKAAVLGMEWSQFRIASMYQEGKGVGKNGREALKWYKIGADRGEDRSKIFIAFMYYEGDGITQDFGEAAKYFLSVNDKDSNVDVLYYLGRMYEYGQGVERNLIEAKKWYNRALSVGPYGYENAIDKALERLK